MKHIDKWELGLVGNASTDISNTYGNDYGNRRYSQVALGGLVGYTFGTVTTEIFATRSVVANNQAPLTLGGPDNPRLGPHHHPAVESSGASAGAGRRQILSFTGSRPGHVTWTGLRAGPFLFRADFYWTPSFFCRFVEEVVYWKVSFLSG